MLCAPGLEIPEQIWHPLEVNQHIKLTARFHYLSVPKLSLLNCFSHLSGPDLSLLNCFSRLQPSLQFSKADIFIYDFLKYIFNQGRKKESNLGIRSWFLIFLKGRSGKCYRDVIICFLPTYKKENGKNSFPSHQVLSSVFYVH